MGPAPKQLANLSQKGSANDAARQRGSVKLAEVTAFHVNFANAKPPTRTYSAELVALQIRNLEVSFVFGQYALTGDTLDSAISLRMHGFFAKQFLTSMEQVSDPTIAEIVENHGIVEESLDSVTNNPDHLAKLDANIVRMAISGYEVCLDFYKLSAFSMLKVKERRGREDLEFTPIARVDMTASKFLGLLSGLKEMVEKMPAFKSQGGE